VLQRIPFFSFSPKNPKKKSYQFTQKYQATLILLVNIRNTSNNHMRMISEGVCGTANWSDAENSALLSQE